MMGKISLGAYYSCLIITWFMLSRSAAVRATAFNYKDALTKSIIFLEAQRSGKLPKVHRPSWRGDSALLDGQFEHVDLVGGYYDAGDNVKYGLPMAFTVTTLAWGAISHQPELRALGELENVRANVRWGTDYLLKASARHNVLYVEVGDPKKDHNCWIRPENMRTPRTVLKIDQNVPGTEIAAETSAALAAASILFKYDDDPAYAQLLLNRSESLYEFANKYRGTYDGECPFYCSCSGFNDELLWAATWLYKATQRQKYMDYILNEATSAAVSEFSWDLKYAGAQILLSKYFFDGKKELQNYKEDADSFVCSILPESPYHHIHTSEAGLIYMREGANSQYVTAAAFLFSVYSDLLRKHNEQVTCGHKNFNSDHLMAFSKNQMDYLLGNNPKGRSYMVGFGKDPPTHAHHRGASVPVLAPEEEINCGMSFVYWFNTKKPNPNELTGAILGGPDRHDNFIDDRTSSSYTEPTSYINSLAVGVLAKLATSYNIVLS